MAGDGVRRGHRPGRDDPPTWPARPRRHRADPRPGRQRAGRRARRRDRAPRREALQHPGDARGPGEAVRLRHRAHRDRPGADPDRAGDRLAGVPLPRGGLRAAGDARQRCLVVGRHALPRAGGPPAVPGRRQPAGRALPDRARGAAALRGCRLAGAGTRGDDDSRPRAAVADRDGAAVPRGRPGDPAGGRLQGRARGHRPGGSRGGRAAPDAVLRRRRGHPGAADRQDHRSAAGRSRS